MPKSPLLQDSALLIQWYRRNKRELPWRVNRDPYRIWISEVMLQQTTVAAVVPYYERFMERFPTLKKLASAKLEDVLENWAGLGYYSRARNLHRAAQALAKTKFPRTHQELLELPGFGPYTARAVASLAFDEKTGVLDGNVIRVLSRRHGLDLEWWKPQARNELQAIADQLAQVEHPSDLNQGLMELGATVCTPHAPACLLCPWASSCVAKQTGQIEVLPRKRPRRQREIWHWQVTLKEKNGRVAFVQNDYAPFLKGHWVLPGSAKRLKSPPREFDYKGCVTHHDIFVSVSVNLRRAAKEVKNPQLKWINRAQVAREVPASIVRKALESRGEKS